MKILVAEDDDYTRNAMIEIFSIEGHTAIAASDGEKAIELFSTERPDFVCLDIMMPKRNGYEVCREIRRVSTEVPVLFVSAKSEEIDKVVGLELGADDYITKPFGVKELLARVKAVSRRYESRSTARFTIGDLVIDEAELRARRGDTDIDLSPRELRILKLFAAHPGRVITRDELFDAGWGMEYLPSSRSLDQFISQLRKKIEVDPSRPKLIVTVHAAGYRYPKSR
jgi:two-component system, OmpR family, alkaline phosphatase synthesis response regulator PhoP